MRANTFMLAAAFVLASACATGPRSRGSVVVKDGLRLHYERIGRKRPVVIVANGSRLRAPLEGLASKRSLVFYDPRGRGQSSPVTRAEEVGIERDVADLEALRKHLRLASVALVGHGYHAAVAAHYASRYPDKVERLVMIAPVPLTQEVYAETRPSAEDSLVDPQRAAELESWRGRGDSEGWCRAYHAVYLPQYAGSSEPNVAFDPSFCRLANEAPDLVARYREWLFEALGDWDFSEAAAKVMTNALVVHGEYDQIVPLGGARRWARAIARGRLIILRDSGHLPWLTASGELLELLDWYLPSRGRNKR